MLIVPDQLEPATELEVFRARVCKVFDGDGFLANVWNPILREWVQRIPFRFAFIDAPEMAQPFGSEARDALARLILGKTLRLEPIGKESTRYLPIDPYRRLLCMAFLTEEMPAGRIEYYREGSYGEGTVRKPRPVTRNIELEMIVNGCAWVITQYVFEREAEYHAAQELAKRQRRGLWAANNPEAPWKFKSRQRRRSTTFLEQGILL